MRNTKRYELLQMLKPESKGIILAERTTWDFNAKEYKIKGEIFTAEEVEKMNATIIRLWPGDSGL